MFCYVLVQATWDCGASRRPHCYWSDVNTTGMGLTVEAALCGKQHRIFSRVICHVTAVFCCFPALCYIMLWGKGAKHNRLSKPKALELLCPAIISQSITSHAKHGSLIVLINALRRKSVIMNFIVKNRVTVVSWETSLFAHLYWRLPKI